MALTDTTMAQVKESVAAHDPEDTAEWMYCYDFSGKVVASFRGINFTVTATRKAYNLAASIADVATVLVYHGRAQSNHQIRISAFHVPTRELAGVVLRKGEELIWTEPSRKDADLLDTITKPRGGS